LEPSHPDEMKPRVVTSLTGRTEHAAVSKHHVMQSKHSRFQNW